MSSYVAKACLTILFCFLFLFLFPVNTFAQVVINEFSSAASTSSDPDWPDWVELYNNSDTDVDLQGWLIKDVTSSSDVATAYEFAGSVIIPAGGFYVQEISNRLNKNGDRILLFQGETQKDCVAYGDGNGFFCEETRTVCIPSQTQSAGRFPDGAGSFVRFASQTKKASNTATQDPCPTPTPTPSPTSTPTPKPTLTPKPTSTPKPTPTIKPTKTPTPKPTVKTKSDKDLELDQNGEILGTSDEPENLRDMFDSKNDEDLNGEEESKNGQRKFPIGAGLLIFGGLSFITAAAYPYIKRFKKGYNFKDGENSKEQETFE